MLKGKRIYSRAATQVIFFLLISTRLYAQYLEHRSAYQFLGASNAYHVIRDRLGFLWFCTNRGIARYDGHTVRYYTEQDGLPDNMVFNAYEDYQGRIWPFCYNGKYCYIYRDKVYNETNNTMLAALPHTNSYITYMASGADSGIYMGFISHSILHLHNTEAHWDKLVTDGGGGLLISASRIIYSPTWAAGITIPLQGDNKLVSDHEGLKVYAKDNLTWQLNDTALTDKTVTDLCLAPDGQLIVCTTHGLEIISTATAKRTRILAGMRITGCVADVAGNFWITTDNNGVYRLHHELGKIHRLQLEEDHEWASVNNNQPVFIIKNNLYALKTNVNGLQYTLVRTGIPNYYNPILLTDRISAFYDTWGKNSIVWSSAGKILFKVPICFKRMYCYSDNRFLAVGKNEIYYYGFKGNRFEELSSSAGHEQVITASCQDVVSKKVYFTCGDSLFVFNFQTGTCETICTSPLLYGSTGIVVRDSDILIAGGRQQYLSFNRSSGILNIHKTTFVVYGFIPFAHSGLILLSEGRNYLARNKDAGYAVIRYPFSPLSYEDIALYGSSCLMRINDRYYYFDTSLLNKHQAPPRIYLQNVTINGKAYNLTNISLKNTVKADVQVNTGLLDFGNNERSIRYRIKGPDGTGNWNIAETPQIAVLLPRAGKYDIEIMPAHAAAANLPLAIAVTLHPPFLQSTPFYILCGIAALVATGMIILLILRYRKLHFRRELNYLKMEHRAINALLNPHFVFNSINNIQNLIHKAEKQEAADYLATLSNLIRQNLENLKCNLIPLKDELALTERYIRLQNLRFNGNIRLHTNHIEPGLLQVQVLPLLVHSFVENAIVHGYRQKGQLFVIDLSIEWHSNRYVKITIRDNGIGLRAAEKHPATHLGSSSGISFNQKRLDRLSEFYNLQQSISVKDRSENSEQGTEVVIIMYAKLKELFELKKLPAY